MPRSQKLVAALGLAIVAYLVSIQILPQLPEGGSYVNLAPANMIIGLIIGWVVVGSRAPSREVSPLTNGITGVLSLILWGLFLNATYEMIVRAMNRRYRSPVDALLDIFEIMVTFGSYITSPGIVLTFIIGAMLTGQLTDRVGRRYG